MVMPLESQVTSERYVTKITSLSGDTTLSSLAPLAVARPEEMIIGMISALDSIACPYNRALF